MEGRLAAGVGSPQFRASALLLEPLDDPWDRTYPSIGSQDHVPKSHQKPVLDFQERPVEDEPDAGDMMSKDGSTSGLPGGAGDPVILETTRLLPCVDLDLLRPVLERLVALLHPEEVWLFGSRAENRARPSSDYDLLAVMPDGTSEEELDPIRAWSLVRGLGVPIDVVPCTRSEFEEEKHEIDTLARAAFVRGVRLYERAA